ncbi:MAG: hypothetical protein LBC64_10825 [Fibromonadaceae bacterium]|nr:hypothetical protein [Fibromonadaceae bacterium]
MKSIVVRAGSACPIIKLATLALAITFTFNACGEKKKQDGTDTKATEPAAEVALPKTKAECPFKKIGSPITVEAVFLGSECGEGCTADFRLANGKTISLGGQIFEDELKKDTKVSITYQREQRWVDLDFIEQGQWCEHSDMLESWKKIGQ